MALEGFLPKIKKDYVLLSAYSLEIFATLISCVSVVGGVIVITKMLEIPKCPDEPLGFFNLLGIPAATALGLFTAVRGNEKCVIVTTKMLGMLKSLDYLQGKSFDYLIALRCITNKILCWDVCYLYSHITNFIAHCIGC